MSTCVPATPVPFPSLSAYTRLLAPCFPLTLRLCMLCGVGSSQSTSKSRSPGQHEAPPTIGKMAHSRPSLWHPQWQDSYRAPQRNLQSANTQWGIRYAQRGMPIPVSETAQTTQHNATARTSLTSPSSQQTKLPKHTHTHTQVQPLGQGQNLMRRHAATCKKTPTCGTPKWSTAACSGIRRPQVLARSVALMPPLSGRPALVALPRAPVVRPS